MSLKIPMQIGKILFFNEMLFRRKKEDSESIEQALSGCRDHDGVDYVLYIHYNPDTIVIRSTSDTIPQVEEPYTAKKLEEVILEFGQVKSIPSGAKLEKIEKSSSVFANEIEGFFDLPEPPYGDEEGEDMFS